MGMKRVMAISPMSTPKTKRTRKRRTLNPVFAAVTAEGIKKAKAMVKKFREAYRLCWLEYKKGKRNMVFPYGTYKMRVMHHVTCATRL